MVGLLFRIGAAVSLLTAALGVWMTTLDSLDNRRWMAEVAVAVLAVVAAVLGILAGHMSLKDSEKTEIQLQNLVAGAKQRHLTEGQVAILRDALTNVSRDVVTVYSSTMTGEEPLLYAEQIHKAMKDQGFNMASNVGLLMAWPVPAGVQVSVRNLGTPPSHAVPIVEAMKRAGVLAATLALDLMLAEYDVRITVGPK